MNRGKTIYISDTVHGSVRLNSLEKQVISTQIFNRLHNISQNSTVYLTFPTNRTKRFEHSIGTMSLCGRIFQESITNSDQETLNDFFGQVESIIDDEINNKLLNHPNDYRGKLGDRNLSFEKLKIYKEMNISSEYNSFIPVNIESKYRNIYVILFQSIRIGALMHDVGHPPFSHITEYALKNIWKKVTEIEEDKRNKRQEKYISSMRPYFEAKNDLHEQIGNKINDKVLDDIIGNMQNFQVNMSEVLEEQLFKVIVSEITSAILNEKNKLFSELHRIIDGALDGDRLDYVSRDPINSGLNVGVIEYERILGGMRLAKVDNCFVFCPSSKVIDSIEDFFNRRWKMYKQIIYHHRVIKTDYLLQTCIENLALDYLKEDDVEESGNTVLPYDISGLWKAISDRPSHTDYFNALIQWDDSWLMTIMKKHYFEKYIEDKESTTFYMLEELLANKKNYYSLVKRMEDFVEIDKQVTNVMAKESEAIRSLINSIKENNPSEETIISNKVLDFILELDDAIRKYNNSTTQYFPLNGFILAKIKKVYNNLFKDDKWLDNIIYENTQYIKDENENIIDAIAVIKKVKTGIDNGKTYSEGGLGLYTNKSGKIEILNFCNLSNLVNILNTDTEYMPVFYLYILKKTNNNVEYEIIKKSLGKRIGNNIAQEIKKKLESIIELQKN